MKSTLFHIGGFALPSYGIFVALGIIAATVICALLARRRGASVDFVLDAIFWAVVGGFAAARLAYVVVTWTHTAAPFRGSLLAGGGGVFLGGFVGGVLATAVVARRHGVPFLAASDLLAPGLTVAHALGRIGCLLAGCCYGRVCSPAFPGAIRYPRETTAAGEIVGSWPFQDQLKQGLVSPADSWTLQTYPTQILETVGLLVLTGLLIALLRRDSRSGAVLATYLISYGLLRFLIEFLRGDADRGIVAGLSVSQWASLILLALGATLFHHIRNKPQGVTSEAPL